MGMESKDKTTFDMVYEENAEIVYKVALKYSGNHHVAEEIVQSVFIKLFVNMEHVNLNAIRPWLILTAKYMSLNYKRDTHREMLMESMDQLETEGHTDVLENSAEDVFMNKLEECEVRGYTGDILEALYRKNERWYDAITFTYLLEKPQKEVAEIMGVSPEVLYSMLYRAKRWIRKNYKGRQDHLHET